MGSGAGGAVTNIFMFTENIFVSKTDLGKKVTRSELGLGGRGGRVGRLLVAVVHFQLV